MMQEHEPTEPVARPRKPYQFTVRTFFAAAVWLGLMMAAVTTLEHEGALGTAVLGLAWIAFAELYRRFRATRALVALGSGPVLLLAVWGVVLVATDTPATGDEVLPPVSWFLAYAFAWGIALSVAVIIERGFQRWLVGPVCRYRRARMSGVPCDPQAGPSCGRLPCAAILFAIHTVLALVALSLGMSEWAVFAAMLLVVVADLPVVPVYFLIPGIGPPGEMPEVALAGLVLGGALYAATGWLVAHLAAPFERRRRAIGPPKGNSGDVSATADGRNA